MTTDKSKITIGLVGPCKSGKTLLKRRLVERGYRVKHIAQEHSYVPDMWQKIAKPDTLIYLKVSFQTTLNRSTLTWSESEYNQQLVRLSHAKKHADLIIDTNQLNPAQVLDSAMSYLENQTSTPK